MKSFHELVRHLVSEYSVHRARFENVFIRKTFIPPANGTFWLCLCF